MRFLVLDSFRGISAVFIILFHSHTLWHFYESSFIRNSFLFVDFFFVLSGFVITHTYEKKLIDSFSVTSFMWKRTGRIYPLHFSILIVFVFFEFVKFFLVKYFDVSLNNIPFTAPNLPDAILPNVFLLQSFLCPELTWNSPSWSISTEFYTYFLFAIICKVFRKNLIFASILLILVSIYFFIYQQYIAILLSQKLSFFIDIFPVLRCVYGFFIGFMINKLYYMLNKYKKLSKKKETTEIFQKEFVVFSLLELLALISIVLFVSHPIKHNYLFLVSFVFGLTVLIFAFERGIISVLLNISFFNKIGEWSYSIYMTHYFIIIIIGMIAKKSKIATIVHSSQVELLNYGSLVQGDCVVLLTVLIVLIISCITYTLLEIPARDTLNRIKLKNLINKAVILRTKLKTNGL